MTVKKVLTAALLTFVVATCVVLIAKAVAPQGEQAEEQPPESVVKVYYLHGNTRCTTCRKIEAYARQSVETGFADDLQSGQIEWQVVNYEEPGNEHFATDYEVLAPTVVLVKYEDGKQTAWKGLPEVWNHVGDKAAFADYVQGNLRQFMEEPVTEEPVTEEPVTEEPVTEEPVTEQPATEEPVTEEPAS